MCELVNLIVVGVDWEKLRMQGDIFVSPVNGRTKLISNGCRRWRSISGDAGRLGRSEIGEPRLRKPMQPLQTVLTLLLRSEIIA